MAAPVGTILTGVTLISGTATFLMFIHEEAVQTIMMAHYIAHKNKMEDEARRLIKIAAEKYIMQGVVFTSDWGHLAPYAQGAFRTYWYSTIDMLETYAKFYKVDIRQPVERMRYLLDHPGLTSGTDVTGLRPTLTTEEAEHAISKKDYNCALLAAIEYLHREPTDVADTRAMQSAGEILRWQKGETDKMGVENDYGRHKCEERKQAFRAGRIP